jgi:DNA-binding NtrC family response regulator
MVAASHDERMGPFGLVVSGEAGNYADALEQIVGPRLLATYRVGRPSEVLEVVDAGLADAVVLDEEFATPEPLRMLRMLRRANPGVLVVMVTVHSDRRWLEEALRLAAFSVVGKPLGLEELLLQIHRMMERLDAAFRQFP